MPDKSRNMNDINDQKTAEQQAFSEEIRRRLAEPGSGKPTLEEFKVLVYKDREKRRKKRNALVACLVAAFIVGYLTYDDLVPEVGADKNPKETIQTEDGVIIEDGGWGSSTGESGEYVIEDVEYIQDILKIEPRVLLPSYISETYNFKRLELDCSEGEIVTCKIFYCNAEKEMVIEEVMEDCSKTAFSIENVSRKLQSKKGDIFIQEMENKIATIQVNDGVMVYILGNIADKEIVKIVNGLSN